MTSDKVGEQMDRAEERNTKFKDRLKKEAPENEG